MTGLLAPTTFGALGTTAMLLVNDPPATNSALDAMRREIVAIDAACSRFRSDSELAAVNAAAGGAVRASPLFCEALDVALRAARLTAGLVDPTVGSALRLLGYDRDFALVDPDGPPLAFVARAVPGWTRVDCDRTTRTVRVPRGVELDLGATAKALCADRAAQSAWRSTGAGVLVSLGGDIAVAGDPPPEGWRVRVTDDHAAPLDGPDQTVAITGGGLATSSISVRRWARGGEVLHHVVDPATGTPAQAVWRTVSVAAGTCVDANIASTAAIILGADAPDWLAERRLPARLVGVDGTITSVAGWPAC